MDDKRVRFDALVLPHLDAAHRFARWLVRSPSDADDIVQKALLRAYRGFDGLRGSDVKAWLLTIVKNCHLTLAAQARGRNLDPLPVPETSALHRDEQRTLTRLMGELSEEHREVLILREIEELSYREISAVANIPIGAVMSRLARARDGLQERWLSELEEENHAVR